MDELQLLVDLHSSTPRQGPGSEKETLRALELTKLANERDLRILDIGCGSGSQTITLAENTHSRIDALDLFPEFLEELQYRAAEKGLDSITTHVANMEELPFPESTFDLIWSEGAIYNIGFKRGIREWKKFLKPGGYIAVSEITWITPTRQKKIHDFWKSEYPEIDLASAKIRTMEEEGFSPVGYFFLDQSSWLENYYQPLVKRFEDFLLKHNHSEEAQNVIKANQDEIALYQEYKDYYSYGFYIGKKV
jgi:ubiquinone/menaquinone biosynthesis C-methylase UbiE